MPRQTKAKKTVTELLQIYARPLTGQEIFRQAKQTLPLLSYSTVYRLLQGLQKEGLVTQVDWRERGARFEWAKLPHHHHLVCQLCGQITDLDDRTIGFEEKTIEKETGFLIKHHTIELEGICPNCQKSSVT